VHTATLLNPSGPDPLARQFTTQGVNGWASAFSYLSDVKTASMSLFSQVLAPQGEDAYASIADIPMFEWVIDVIPSAPTPGNTILRDVTLTTASSATTEGALYGDHANGAALFADHLCGSVAGSWSFYAEAPIFFPPHWVDTVVWQDGTSMTPNLPPAIMEYEDVVFTRVPSPNGQRRYRGTVAISVDVDLVSTIFVASGNPFGGSSQAAYDATITLAEVKQPD
jgi:hypothetical protein